MIIVLSVFCKQTQNNHNAAVMLSQAV